MVSSQAPHQSPGDPRGCVLQQGVPAGDSSCPWVLVAGGFHRNGGMDKANLALAQYLVEQGTPVHIVCHTIDEDFSKYPSVTVHLVPRPAGSFFLGRPMLDMKGRKIARMITRQAPDARVVVNGDNCLWPGINWVHYLHHAWAPPAAKGPLWFRAKQALSNTLVRHREKSAARMSRVFITNSNRTRRDLIDRLHVKPERVHTVYLGAETEWGPVSDHQRAANRQRLGIPGARPVALFLGSLGFDHRKGFDLLFEAWVKLCANPDWDVDLLVAGAGNALAMWRSEVSRRGMEQRIRLLGFSDRVPDLLAAADVLVSPARYEPYGLNVQEAICRGVPAIVSVGAGVAERYGPELRPLLLQNPEDVDELTALLRTWRSRMDFWKDAFRQFGDSLRAYGWNDMARQIVSIAANCQGNGNQAR
jgi:glycosyltransferase involved in cell wall biosynthesis